MSGGERWIVKQVLSGDSVILRSKLEVNDSIAVVKEKYIILANITAPKLLKKNPANENELQRDEPFAWASREYLKSLVLSKNVVFKSIHSNKEKDDKTDKKDYGNIFIDQSNNLVDVNELMISSGYCEVKPTKDSKLDLKRYYELQKVSQSNYSGKWAIGKDQNFADMIRQVKFDYVTDTTPVSEYEKFYENNKSKDLPIIIENVKDGSNYRAFVFPEMVSKQNGYTSTQISCSAYGPFFSVNVSLTGVKAPTVKYKQADNQKNEEEYFKEAQFFTESRILQADKLLCRLEGVFGKTFLITIIHSRGNIALFLLKEGLAKCNELTIHKLSANFESYRVSESEAKLKKIRIWKDLASYTSVSNNSNSSFEGWILEICPNISINVLTTDRVEKKLILSSFIIPKKYIQVENKNNENTLSNEIREFLRLMLINKKVSVYVDYIKDDRIYATVKLLPDMKNIASEIIRNGLGMVLKSKSDEKSKEYDILVVAENEAIQKKVGIHSENFKFEKIRYVDISTDLIKAKQYKSFLDRAGRMQGIVDHVYGASKFKIRIPKENCVVSFVLAGVACPKYSATNKTSEPFSTEAFVFVKRLLTQQEIELEVLSIDKNGNYVGWLYLKHKIPPFFNHQTKFVNISMILLEIGYAKIHSSSDKLPFYNDLLKVQEKAHQNKLNVWSICETKQDSFDKSNHIDLTASSTTEETNLLIVTSTSGDNCLNIWAQDTNLAEQFMKINNEIKNQEQVGFTQNRLQMNIGTLCCVKFSDKKWYRAKIEKFEPRGYCLVRLVDYGNIFAALKDDLQQLPESCYDAPFVARSYHLSFIEFPQNLQDFADEVRYVTKRRLMSVPSKAKIFTSNKCKTVFCSFICNKHDLTHNNILLDKVKLENIDFDDESSIDQLWMLCQIDVSMELLGKGWCILSKDNIHFDCPLINAYQIVQNTAKSRRLGLWRFGDPNSIDSE